MVFCGQCGLQLTPGDTRCPRCGAAVDTDSAVEDIHEGTQANSPTVGIPYMNNDLSQPATRGEPYTPVNPQPLILSGRDKSGPYEVQGAYEATQQMDASDYGTGTARFPSNPNMDASYPGYAPQSYPEQNSANYPSGAAYPGFAPPGGTGYSAPGQQLRGNSAAQNTKGRSAALVIILLGLLIILGAMALFAIQRGLLGSLGGLGAGSGPLPPSTTQQARAVVQQYYDDINSRRYKAAYDLLRDTPQKRPFVAFRDGYKYTEHDNVTFGEITAQNDGTVKVLVTLMATERALSGGTRQSTYKGYYIVAQQGGTWKIFDGQLNLA